MERTANRDEICLPLIAPPDQDDDHKEESCKKKKKIKDDDDSQKKQPRVWLVAVTVVGYPLFILVVLISLGLVSVLLYQQSWLLFFVTPPKTTAAVTEAAGTTNHTTTWWSDKSNSSSSSAVWWSMVGFFTSSTLYRYTLCYAATSNQPDGAGDWTVLLHVLPELVTLCILGLCCAGQAEVAAVVFQVGELVMLTAIEVYWVGQLSWSWCQSRRQRRKTSDDDIDEAVLSTTATDGHAFDKNCSGHAV
jgi:hypothetical protein